MTHYTRCTYIHRYTPYLHTNTRTHTYVPFVLNLKETVLWQMAVGYKKQAVEAQMHHFSINIKADSECKGKIHPIIYSNKQLNFCNIYVCMHVGMP